MSIKTIQDFAFGAFEEVPLVIAVYDTDNRVVFANHAYRDATGKTSEEIIGRNCYQTWDLQSLCSGCPVVIALETGRPADAEMSPGSQGHWPSSMGAWQNHAAPLFDDQGRLLGAIEIAVSVTRRTRAEEQLARQARRQRMIIDILQFPADNLQSFLDHALNKAIELTESRIGYIYYYDEEAREFTLNSWSRDVMKDCAVANPQSKYDLDKTGFWGEAVRQRRAILVNDFAAPDPLKKGIPEGHVQLKKFLTIPVFQQERIVAVVGVANKPTDYDETDELQLTLLMDAVWKSVEIIRGREALHGSIEQVRALVETLPDVVMRFDLEERHLFVSENVEAATGVPASMFFGKTHREMGFPEELCEFWEDQLKLVLQSGSPLETEFVINGPKGETIFEWRLVPERDSGGEVQGVVTLARDVTQERRTQREYRSLFREMLDGFALHEMIYDAHGNPSDYRFLAVNPAFERMTGLSAEQIVGKTVLEVMPGTEMHWIETYGKVVQTGAPVFFENYATSLGRHFEVKAFRCAPGQFTCIFSDVTERLRAEQERERLREQLAQAQKMESIGRLAGGVAHDFNNMLNIILSNAEMALEDVPLFSPLHEAVSQIQKAAKRSAALTAQLLAFARKQPVVPRRLDLNARVEGMLKMLRRLIGEDIELAWQPGVEVGTILMDPSQLDQVLANLCVNARDAIEGGGRITIETADVVLAETDCANLAEAVPGPYVMLMVSDTGQGMDEQTRARLFEPFFTTKALGKGTGLGLATIFGIVSQNNGAICVRSEVGQGTTFRIFLPRQVEVAAPVVQEATRADVFGSETLLLVEDEPEILHVARRILERHGYHVLIAATPAEAILQATEHAAEIRLLVSDVIMPEMNGRDLARRLIALIPDLKCLFMSGYTADYIAHHGVLDEGVHFIQKPFSKKAFTEMVRQVLDSSAPSAPK